MYLKSSTCVNSEESRKDKQETEMSKPLTSSVPTPQV